MIPPSAHKSKTTVVTSRFPSEPPGDGHFEALRFAVLGDVPQNARRIAKIQYPQSPRLHFGGFARDAGIFLGKIFFLYVFPPRVRIVDSETHHKISRMLRNVELLQQKAEGTDLKFHN